MLDLGDEYVAVGALGQPSPALVELVFLRTDEVIHGDPLQSNVSIGAPLAVGIVEDSAGFADARRCFGI